VAGRCAGGRLGGALLDGLWGAGRHPQAVVGEGFAQRRPGGALNRPGIRTQGSSVEQSIAHLANAWALRRWRGLLYRLRDIYCAAGVLVCLGRWLRRVPV
jgi:hypothetical protein